MGKTFKMGKLNFIQVLYLVPVCGQARVKYLPGLQEHLVLRTNLSIKSSPLSANAPF